MSAKLSTVEHALLPAAIRTGQPIDRLARGEYPAPLPDDPTGPLMRRVAALEESHAKTAAALADLTRILARVQAEVAMLRAQVPSV